MGNLCTLHPAEAVGSCYHRYSPNLTIKHGAVEMTLVALQQAYLSSSLGRRLRIVSSFEQFSRLAPRRERERERESVSEKLGIHGMASVIFGISIDSTEVVLESTLEVSRVHALRVSTSSSTTRCCSCGHRPVPSYTRFTNTMFDVTW